MIWCKEWLHRRADLGSHVTRRAILCFTSSSFMLVPISFRFSVIYLNASVCWSWSQYTSFVTSQRQGCCWQNSINFTVTSIDQCSLDMSDGCWWNVRTNSLWVLAYNVNVHLAAPSPQTHCLTLTTNRQSLSMLQNNRVNLYDALLTVSPFLTSHRAKFAKQSSLIWTGP